MAKICQICGKGKVGGFQISHSHIKTKRLWRPNIHKVKALVKGTSRRINVCSRCLKSGRVERSI
ncbi:MAG: 50S ribosomal protein L28 [Dethiobacteria bacterium]|nr:50S ribosomal protein L28 [Bacillota bacterium]HOJ84809.1 50S ribosomal protein L28 [Bacillota bacterium]HOL16249.1 50S ribosomal protein L28 [Bacillota bacterium]